MGLRALAEVTAVTACRRRALHGRGGRRGQDPRRAGQRRRAAGDRRPRAGRRDGAPAPGHDHGALPRRRAPRPPGGDHRGAARGPPRVRPRAGPGRRGHARAGGDRHLHRPRQRDRADARGGRPAADARPGPDDPVATRDRRATPTPRTCSRCSATVSTRPASGGPWARSPATPWSRRGPPRPSATGTRWTCWCSPTSTRRRSSTPGCRSPGSPPSSSPCSCVACRAGDDPVACRFWTSSVTDGYLEEDGLIRAEDGRLLAVSRQLALAPRPGTDHGPDRRGLRRGRRPRLGRSVRALRRQRHRRRRRGGAGRGRHARHGRGGPRARRATSPGSGPATSWPCSTPTPTSTTRSGTWRSRAWRSGVTAASPSCWATTRPWRPGSSSSRPGTRTPTGCAPHRGCRRPGPSRTRPRWTSVTGGWCCGSSAAATPTTTRWSTCPTTTSCWPATWSRRPVPRSSATPTRSPGRAPSERCSDWDAAPWCPGHGTAVDAAFVRDQHDDLAGLAQVLAAGLTGAMAREEVLSSSPFDPDTTAVALSRAPHDPDAPSAGTRRRW